MRWVLVAICLVVCVAGCSGSSGTPDAGRWPDARGRPDAGVDAPFADASVAAGRVCVVIDLRLWANGCLSDNADQMTVTVTNQLGSAEATTDDQGRFWIENPPPPPALVRVSSTGAPTDIVTSVAVWEGPPESFIAIPAPLRSYWNTLETDSGVMVSEGNGSALVRFTYNGDPVSGGLVTSNPPLATGVVNYDGASATDWDTDATGTQGMALLSDLPAQRVTVTAIQMARVGDATVDVEAGALTFATGVME